MCANLWDSLQGTWIGKSFKETFWLSHATDRISSLRDLSLRRISQLSTALASTCHEISHGSPQSFIRTGLSLAVFILGHSKSKLIPGCALRHTAVRLSLSLQKCVDGMGIQVEHVILSSFNVFPLQGHLWHWTMCDRHKQKNNPSLIYGKAFWTSVMVDSLMHFVTPAVLHVYIWNICTSSSWHDQSIVNLLLTLEAPACTGCTNSLDLIIVLQNKHSNFRACLLWLPKFMEICSCASDAVAFQVQLYENESFECVHIWMHLSLNFDAAARELTVIITVFSLVPLLSRNISGRTSECENIWHKKNMTVWADSQTCNINMLVIVYLAHWPWHIHLKQK